MRVDQFVRRLALLGLGLAILTTVGCIHVFVRTDVSAVARPSGAGVDSIRSQLKAHLLDGSAVLFPSGGVVTTDRLTGYGLHYPLFASEPTVRSSVPMDSIVAVEAFRGRTLAGTSLVASAAATAVTALAALAIFGSCPTVYADTGNGPVLQAEGFSYALSPLMEHRDLDPLTVRPDADGTIRLELRNEALETHFINHVEVVAVRHGALTRVVPDQLGHPVEVGGFARLVGARDRAKRDVLSTLSDADGTLYSTDSSVLHNAKAGDLDDWIDLDLAGLPAGDSLVVLLRLRNSLLNTVLLYEGMLGGRDGADWMTEDLEHIGRTVELARWYVATMGMRAIVAEVPLPTGAPYDGHARLSDVGPIAFRDVAIVLPRPATRDGRARVRLAFVADNWRIDRIQVAGNHARPSARTLAVERIVVPTPAVGEGPIEDGAALPLITTADESYLETRPGQRMTLVFERDRVAVPAADETDTYLIAWQGWYREWVRGSWLAAPTRTTPFVPGDAALVTALRRWATRLPSFEREFYSSAIPVR